MFILFLLMQLADSQAQIRLDGSLGPQGDLSGPDYTIPAEAGQQRGGNLFHSFDQFHIRTGESATFTGPNQIDHVIGRVTGGHASTIDGLLRSAIPDANLFLLNPQGVVFGPNARLDVDGSFHTSTADVLRFEDGAAFFADLGKQSALTIATPAAFGFLQAQPAPITVQGSELQVPEGETLALIGGTIDITGSPDDFFAEPTLGAPSGRIHLISAGSPGAVEISASGPSSQTLSHFGDITLSNAALLSVSGAPAGTVVIRGRNLSLDSSDVFADTFGNRDGAAIGVDIAVSETFVYMSGGALTADSFGAGNAGDIRIAADVLQMEGETFIASGAFADGDAGDITVAAATVMLTGGALIESSAFDLGQGGTVTIRATDELLLSGTTVDGLFPSAISAQTEGMGNAGSVLIEAKMVTLTGGATISSTTLGPGRGGAVTVRASDALILTGTNQDGSLPSSISANALGFEGEEIGDGGSIRVQTRTVELTGGAQISTETISNGRGGTITVQATGTVTLTGVDINNLPSAISAQSLGGGSNAGDGGAILIEARAVTMTGGAEISSSTAGTGRGGAVMVVATETIAIEDQDTFITADSIGSGAGGEIRVSARDIHLRRAALISSESFGEGDAGDIAITTDTLRLSDGSMISTKAATADGGEIRLMVGTQTQLRDSQITAEVGSGAGSGGNLSADSTFIVLQNSQFRANAFGGPGGSIIVQAEVFLADPDSRVTASSALNVDGIVDIRAPVTELSNAVIPLSKRFASAASLLSQRCVARRQEETDSRFFLTGRDRVPAHPGGTLPSPLQPVSWSIPQPTAGAPMRSYDLHARAIDHRNPCPR